MYLKSSQLVVADPFLPAGHADTGIINNVKTGEWLLYTQRRKTTLDEVVVTVVLMHEEASIVMRQFGGNLVALSDVYGTGFKPEHFEVAINRRLIGFFDFAVFLKEKEKRLTNDFLVNILMSGEASVSFKGTRHGELRRVFDAGMVVNTLRDPRTVSVSTLRDEDNQAVALFMHLGSETH